MVFSRQDAAPTKSTQISWERRPAAILRDGNTPVAIERLPEHIEFTDVLQTTSQAGGPTLCDSVQP